MTILFLCCPGQNRPAIETRCPNEAKFWATCGYKVLPLPLSD